MDKIKLQVARALALLTFLHLSFFVIPLSQWAFILSLGGMGILFIIKRQKLIFPPGYLLLGGFCIWALISLLTAPTNISSLSQHYEWATGANSIQWRGIAMWIRLCVSVFSIGLVYNLITSKHVLLDTIKYYYYGYAALVLFCLAQILLGIVGIEIGNICHPPFVTFGRIAGVYTEPIHLAQILLIGLPLLYYIDRYIHISFLRYRYLIIPTLLVLFNTFSASAFIALGVTFVIFNIKKIKYLFYFALGSISLITIFHRQMHYMLLWKFERMFKLNERGISLLFGLELIKDYPLKGVGIGRSPFFLGNYPSLLTERVRYLCLFRGRFVPMNTLMNITAETGIIGLAILISFGVYVVLFLKKNPIMLEYQPLFKGILMGIVSFGITLLSTPDGIFIPYFHFFVGLLLVTLSIFKIQKGHV